MEHRFTTSWLEDSLSNFRQYKLLAEQAMNQLTEEQLFAVLDEEMNSIAVIVKHMAGNMRSRWSGFPEADGEKPSRDREGEFSDPAGSREEVMRIWEEGWDRVFAALTPLSDADMVRITTIRGERYSVVQAVNRQLTHYAYHCGQIVFLAKHLRGNDWRPLTTPLGESARAKRHAGKH